MKVAIVGPGALGSFVAALLKHRTKEEVWLLDKYASRARSLAQTGVTVEGFSGSLRARVSVTADPRRIGQADLVMLCVKSFSTDEACKEAASLVGDRTRVLSLQNGIGNMQIMTDHFGAGRVVAGITNHGATLMDVGHVRHAGKGETVIGTADGRVLGEIRAVSSLLGRAGLETKISKDIQSVLWSKLVINAGINAVSALARLPNGGLLSSEEARQVMRAAAAEAAKVARRKRVKLTYDDAIQKVETVCRATADNLSSMLQDAMKKKRTEVEYINGAVVRQGKALNIPTPVNETLTCLVKALESGYPRPR